MMTLAAVAALGSFVQVRPVMADACLDDTRTAYSECKGDCKEAYQGAKDTCQNRDHACVESCRADRQVCTQPTRDALNAAIDACQDTLSAARATCRATYADGSPELDACIDQAQVVAFLCRKTARKVAKPELTACRTAFKVCVKTNCPQSAVPDRAALKACKVDAKGQLDACVADCVEARQLAKDTCLNRDHVCVEACRAARDVCREPFVAQRVAAVLACAADRDAAFDNCRALYAVGTPERDACITQAQVDAFSCRDDAREAVHAELAACRAGFQACAGACPTLP